MPQASDSLRAKFPGFDEEAIEVLESAGWTCEGGVWSGPLPSAGPEPSDREWEALQYLCDEWDHALGSRRGPRETVAVLAPAAPPDASDCVRIVTITAFALAAVTALVMLADAL